ncbi:MAG TPA: helix-hairpin-helix domain-containing protein [Bacilli bacterium]|nr:helix-hairpin-helix domain-containing protein [Bacilli bacterium]
MYKVMIAVIIFTITTLIILLSLDPNINANSVALQSSAGAYFSASISGQVLRPGTYAMDEGDQLGDLIEKAGGVTENADERAYTLDCLIVNAMSYYIAPLYAEDDICGDYPYPKVGINSGTKEDLLVISGVGTTISAAIVGYREQHGSYSYLEQIKQVSGIGNATFEKIKNYITLE